MKVIEQNEIDLTEFVRPGDTVLFGQGAGESLFFSNALIDQRSRLGNINVFLGIGGLGAFRPEHTDFLNFISYCGSGRNRYLAECGCLDIIPCHYSQLPLLMRSGELKIDVVIIQIPPADNRGYYSLGLSHDYLQAAISQARVVLAEVNSQAPWTSGSFCLSSEDIDAAVLTSQSILEAPSIKIGAVEFAIGRHIANMVENGSTLQLGIGAIPEAVLTALSEHRDLGLHSGIISNGAANLIKKGVMTNSCKTIDRGVAVAGMAMGERWLYDFLDRNLKVVFRSAEYTHAYDVLARIDRFVAINSALEVDLSGQINSEMVDGVYVGGVGGILNFLRGAAKSRGGLPIVALPSTTLSGRSRIVPCLRGPVTVARSDVGVVVTEYGVADLRGLSVSKRIERMLAVSHPDVRDSLINGMRN